MPAKRTEAQRLLRRSKDSEREGCRWAQEHDGPDPQFPPGGGLVTTSGRVGHISNLRFDGLSRSYCLENKHHRLNKEWSEWWALIVQRAGRHGKAPLLRIDPSNKPCTFEVDGEQVHLPVMHVITEERHAHLLDMERAHLACQGKGPSKSRGS